VVDWRGLTVASYDEKRQAMVFREPNALALNRGTQRLTEFGAAAWASTDASSSSSSSSPVSVVATHNHEMYVRLPHEQRFQKRTCDDIVTHARDHDDADVAFLTAARNGVVGASSDADQFACLFLSSVIDVDNQRQAAALLQLYGYWCVVCCLFFAISYIYCIFCL